MSFLGVFCDSALRICSRSRRLKPAATETAVFVAAGFSLRPHVGTDSESFSTERAKWAKVDRESSGSFTNEKKKD
jgi:hypothetical protein